MRKLLFLILLAAFVASCASGASIQKQTAFRGKKVHVVKRGETMSQIAQKYGVGVGTIKSANELDSSNITAGQRLIIPLGKKFKSRGQPDIFAKKKPSGKKKKFYPPKKAPRTNAKLIWPVKNPTVTSRFGIRGNGKHDGIDMGMPKGTKILAAAAGTVIFSNWGPKGYGLIVVIKHSSKLVTVYAHNKKNLVKKGQKVRQGATIALVGNTGKSSGPHLHFEVRVNRIPYNPLKYLPKRRK